MLLALIAPTAQAFCGTYVGSPGAVLESEVSQVVIAHHEDRISLTLANDYQGDSRDFALVIPVPEVLLAEDVALPDASIFPELDLFTGPRLVRYTCDDFRYESDTDTDADTDSDTGPDMGGPADGVVVESSFTKGAYEFVVLSATGAEGLLGWLDAHGYALDATAAPVIQEYIDQDLFFLAARVSLGNEVPVGGSSFLPPIRLTYGIQGGTSFTLPIRIGTTVSPGEQEVVAYILSDRQVSISNYPEAELETGCMLPPEVSALDHHQMALDEAFAKATWVQEYSWNISSCDPCPAEPPGEVTLQALDGVGLSQITRIRARFTPEEATSDLGLYDTGKWAAEQVRYVEYDPRLEDRFPLCGIGWAESPGTCDDLPGSAHAPFVDEILRADGQGARDEKRCATGPMGAWAGLWVAALALLRRRK